MSFEIWHLHSWYLEPYIKNLVAGRTDEKPFEDITVPFKHGVEAVFVSTRWTNLEFVNQFNFFYFIVHKVISNNFVALSKDRPEDK